QAIGRITDLELGVMCGTYMEVHEQRELQSLQDLIIQNMPITVLCLDNHGRVTSATRPTAADMLTDIRPLRAHYTDFLSSELREAADFSTHLAEAVATDEIVTIPRVVIGDGFEARYFRVTLLPLQHELARVLVHIEELTDVVQAQSRAQQAENLARLGSLAANVAHEIRNPLSAISATLQVIGSSLSQDDRRKKIISKVNGQVLRLDRLVTDLLGYARPVRARLNPTDLVELCREAAAQSSTSPVIDVADTVDGPLRVKADSQYVQQILVNLLQNARDAAGDDGTVWLRVGPGPVVEVADSGSGIDPMIADRLFEPFVTTKTRGTGLGLAISRKLAESMSGALTLLPSNTTPTSGARFQLTLRPAKRDAHPSGHTSPDGIEARTG
ncbi:MAG: ATP-binding protein, partial [Myxococcota bacterium]